MNTQVNINNHMVPFKMCQRLLAENRTSSATPPRSKVPWAPSSWEQRKAAPTLWAKRRPWSTSKHGSFAPDAWWSTGWNTGRFGKGSWLWKAAMQKCWEVARIFWGGLVKKNVLFFVWFFKGVKDAWSLKYTKVTMYWNVNNVVSFNLTIYTF